MRRMLMPMHCWQGDYGQSGTLEYPAGGSAPLQFALMPPRTSCILQNCTVFPSGGRNVAINALPFGSKPPLRYLTQLLIRLQVGLFPLQASRSGLCDEPDLASPVLHFPMLRAVVEFDG